MVFALASFSMSASIDQKSIDVEQDCVAYAKAASTAEYEATTPLVAQIIDTQWGGAWYLAQTQQYYNDWYEVCQESGGTALPPVFIGF